MEAPWNPQTRIAILHEMEFQFDLIWREGTDEKIADLAEALVTEPAVLINPGVKEDSRIIQGLYQP